MVGSSLRVESVHQVWGADARTGVLEGPDGSQVRVLVRLSPVDATPEALARGQEDLAELRRVRAPSVLPVEQIVPVGGQVARVYTWFSGSSLRVLSDAARATGGSLPARVAVEAVARVAHALAAAAAAPGGHVQHAGCGPEDVLLDRAGEVRATGFVVLRPGEMLGMRPGYRAPAEADPWTYMAGALLFELLAGEAPPEAGDSADRHAVIVRRALIRALARPGDSPGEAVGQAMRQAMGWDVRTPVDELGRTLEALALRVPGPSLADWAATTLGGPAAGSRGPAPLPVATPSPAPRVVTPPPARPTAPAAMTLAPSSSDTFTPESGPAPAPPAPPAYTPPPPPRLVSFPPAPAPGFPAGARPAAGPRPAPPPLALAKSATDPMGEQAPRARVRGGVEIGEPGLGGAMDPPPGLPSIGLRLDEDAPPPVRTTGDRRGLVLSVVAAVALVGLAGVAVAAGWAIFGGDDTEAVVAPADVPVEPAEPPPDTPPAVVPAPAAAPTTPAPAPAAVAAPVAAPSAAPAAAPGASLPRAPAPAAAPVEDDPDAPTRLTPSTDPAATRVVASPPAEPAPAVAPPPVEAPPDLPGPFSVSFAAGDPAITRIEVKCGDVSAAGAPPVAVSAAPKGSCKVTGLGGAAPLITLVTLSSDRAYTCFPGGARSCR